MLKQTVRFACLALLMFAASATPLTANATRSSSMAHSPYPLPASQLRAFSAALSAGAVR